MNELPLQPAMPAAFDLEGLRAARRGRPAMPYDRLDIASWPDARTLRRRGETLLADGWTLAGTFVTRLTPPIQWTGHARSTNFHLNAWEPISRLLAAHAVTGELAFFDAAHEAARDWLARHHDPALAAAPDEVLDAALGRPEDFVWYDMGVGQRCYRIAYLLDELLRRDGAPAGELELFADALIFHQRALSRDSFFSVHNNHGIFQALGQWAGARRFPDLAGMTAWAELGERRMAAILDAHFTETGVHKEHSPAYHFLMLEMLLGARQSGLLRGPPWDEAFGRMESALVWMIQPDHSHATIGDTDPRTMADADAGGRYEDPELIFMASGGAAGTPPRYGVKAYLDAGYAFARLSPDPAAPPREASYLAVMAGFHSRTHKHADHLSFVWHDGGQCVLADPGRYAYAGKSKPGSALHKAGFWYDDPKRVYVESTHAHNTVEIDGRDFTRVGVTPWGSAIVSATEQSGIFAGEFENSPFWLNPPSPAADHETGRIPAGDRLAGRPRPEAA